MQPGQAGFRGANHAMTLASGPQAGQPNLGQANPAAQQQFLQQQSMQRLGLGLPQQQQQQQQQSQLASGNAPGMGALQHPGLANAGQPHLNNLAQANNPALLSLINMGQSNNHLMNNLLRNNNMLDTHNLNRLDPLMSEQVSGALASGVIVPAPMQQLTGVIHSYKQCTAPGTASRLKGELVLQRTNTSDSPMAITILLFSRHLTIRIL